MGLISNDHDGEIALYLQLPRIATEEKEGKVLDRELTRVAKREVTPALLAADDDGGNFAGRDR